MTKTVSFTQMKDGTREDYALLEEFEAAYHSGTADRVIAELKRQGETSLEGYKITRLDHALQSATRAEADGADLDWIVGALLHDIGDGLAPQNHDRFSAEVIRPFVRWEVSWVVEHHGIFQMIYYAHRPQTRTCASRPCLWLVSTASRTRSIQAKPWTRTCTICRQKSWKVFQRFVRLFAKPWTSWKPIWTSFSPATSSPKTRSRATWTSSGKKFTPTSTRRTRWNSSCTTAANQSGFGNRKGVPYGAPFFFWHVSLDLRRMLYANGRISPLRCFCRYAVPSVS